MITLDKIEGMNLSVGTPIELTIKDGVSDKSYRKMVYFKNVDEEGVGHVNYTEAKSDEGEMNSSYHGGCMVPLIEEIKILTYSDSTK